MRRCRRGFGIVDGVVAVRQRSLVAFVDGVGRQRWRGSVVLISRRRTFRRQSFVASLIKHQILDT